MMCYFKTANLFSIQILWRNLLSHHQSQNGTREMGFRKIKNLFVTVNQRAWTTSIKHRQRWKINKSWLKPIDVLWFFSKFQIIKMLQIEINYMYYSIYLSLPSSWLYIKMQMLGGGGEWLFLTQFCSLGYHPIFRRHITNMWYYNI